MQRPWRTEPDREEFEHAGFPCILNRNQLGAWCGYVGVPPGHKAHGEGYDSVPVEVHGGLTYASECSGQICHVPKPGESDHVWWFGFDCAHYQDLVPNLHDPESDHNQHMERIHPGWNSRVREENMIYRDIAYVRAETKSLAEQLAVMA